ncbi:RNA exonuclease 4 [Pestalotiopsis fici W106-1]|uniref:RNA exonuclease 4 n=1 Tax=Pestalotiopsis fici (strain W106-1 / CGMCC3.15140) TaxID=1229662 RepID=W3WPX1_PESFW|nr:RNA exonuclease 4 [Pestalotiopsis fici W106-1]ETS75839.1 RNA exonuclease 4 [Pestalotiopsis fici W106-1]
MAAGLSSNWKKLQATLKTESSSTPAKDKAPAKRKAGGSLTAQPKRQRLEQTQKTDRPVAKPTPKGTKSSGAAMGVAQSSAVAKGSSSTVNPSLALWAEDNDISAEALAEAYGLGIKRNALVVSEQPRVNEGLAPGIEIGKYVAMDCEMVGVGPDGHDSVLARVSLVDFHGRQVYDSFVRPRERVTDWRTKITGITPKHMATAREFDAVQQEVADLIQGRILVGHDIRHDLAVLMLTHPTTHIRDTARFAGFRQYGHGPKPALRTLAKELLDMEIQTGHHSSIEDAKVAMLLFRKKKSEFDMEHANKFERTEKAAGKGGNKSKTGKKKSRR